VRGQFEQLDVAFQTILKSKEKADLLFAATVKFAATTPFNLTEVATATKQLLAYGFASKDITDVLTTLGNVAAGVSAPIGDIVYLYGTLKTQGRAYAQDIRQFTGRGIPIIAELAKQFGVTEDRVNKLVEAGKVGFPEVEKAFKSLTGSSGIFYNLMEKQSQTLTGQLSNLQDAFTQMLNSLGQSSEGALNGGIAIAAELVANYQKVLDIVEVLIITYGSYRAVLLLQTAASLANTVAIGLETVAYRILRDGLELLNAEKVVAVASTAAYTAVIAALVVALKSWHDASSLQNQIASETNNITNEASVKVDLQKTKIKDLTAIINDHNATQDERLGALKKLNEISPKYLGNITLETANTKAASQAIKDYLGDLDKKLVGEAAYSQKLENLKKIAELKTKGVDAIDPFQRAGLSIKRLFTFNSSASSLVSGQQDDQDTVNQLIASYEKANANINKLFGAQIKSSLSGTDSPGAIVASKFQGDLKTALAANGVKSILDSFNKLINEAESATDLEALRDGLSEKLKSLAPNDKQIGVLKQRLADVKKVLDTYSLSADGKAADSAFNAAQRYGDLIEKIYQLNEKYNANALTDNEQKLQAIRNEYDKLRVDIDKYNANPKNTKKINKGTLQANETAAVNTQVESNETKDIASGIEQQKALYDEYYAYRDKLGKAAADQQYAELLEGGKDFGAYIKLIESLFLSSDLTPQAYEERKNLFAKYSQEFKKDQATQNIDLLGSTLSYYEQLSVADDKYQRDRAALEQQGNFSAVDELDKQHKAEIEQISATNAEKILVLKEYNGNVAQLTKEQAKAQLQTLKELQANSNLSPEQNGKIDENVERLQNALKGINGLSKDYTGNLNEQKAKLLSVLGTLPAYGEEWKKIAAEIEAINTKLQSQKTAVKTLGDISKYANDASQGFANIASSLQDINPGLADTLNTLSQIAKTAGDVAGLGTSISSGDVGGIISGVTSVVSDVVGIFSAGKKSRIEAENQLKQIQESLYSGELAYSQLLRDRARTQADITGMTLQELAARQQLLANQKLQAQADYNSLLAKIQGQGQQITGDHLEKYGGFLGIGKKTKVVQDLAGLGGADYDKLEELYTKGQLTDATKAWFEELQKVHDEMGDVSDATQQVNDEIDQIFTGTTADSLTKSILDGLKNGKRGFGDFSDDFGASVQDSLDSVFEDSFKGKVADYYKQFAALSESGGGLDASELVKLKALYAQLINDGSKEYDDLKNAIGDTGTVPTPDQSTLQGAIKGITSDEAGVLAGTTHGIQLGVLQIVDQSKANSKTMLDGLAELRQQTLYQFQIAGYTKRTADTNDSIDKTLQDMNKKMSNSANDLAAAGRTL